MKKLEPKTQDWIYLNERYEVCSSNGCCTIGEIYLDHVEDEWVFDIETRERTGAGSVYYTGEMEEINRLLNILNKRDKLGKYKRVVEKKTEEEKNG